MTKIIKRECKICKWKGYVIGMKDKNKCCYCKGLDKINKYRGIKN